ncbi:MAG: S41 family peptidase, partial [Planctomycetota bacterium]|nr:S41 family peptidase [Planctomycetota bacterium]
SDPELRALGALGLAAAREEIYGKLRTELERLARLPNEHGALASSYLENERQREHNDRTIKELLTRLAEDGETMPKSLRDFVAVMKMIENHHLEGDRVSERDLIEAALGGMLRYMDEHSSFLSGESYGKFLLDLEAEYGGIGAYVGMDPNTGLFTINRPIYSGPAYRAGLVTDDRIVRIGDWPTIGKNIEDIIKRLKGKPATEVKLYVWRRGMDPDLIERPNEEMALVLKREAIQIPAVAWQMLPGGIGMVELSTFSRNVHEELAATFAHMKDEKNMRALIFDLRRNSGGLLTEARNVADLFLPRGERVVTTEGFGRPEPHHTYRGVAIPEDMPIVVLVSRYTASASEIVAGALKDHGRATILGEKTFGKGSVQQLMPVLGVEEDEYEDKNGNHRWDQWEPITVDHDGDGEVDYAPRVKLTIARYLLPSGRSIHREFDEEGNVISEGGIEPDVEVRNPLIESWRYNERWRLGREERVARDYVAEHWDENRELFRQLAVNDYKDASLYPDFDAFMAGLDTTLPRGDVRMLLRNEVRRRIQDDRGAEFPPGDYVEDYQVQRAIEVALKNFDDSPERYEEYKRTFLGDEEIDDAHLVAVDFQRLERMRDAAALIRDIQDGNVEASPEKLAELLRILSEEDR